jgi:hypothetical protein
MAITVCYGKEHRLQDGKAGAKTFKQFPSLLGGA